MDTRLVECLRNTFFTAFVDVNIVGLHELEEYISTKLTKEEAKEIEEAITDYMGDGYVDAYIEEFFRMAEFLPYVMRALKKKEKARCVEQMKGLNAIQKQIKILSKTL